MSTNLPKATVPVREMVARRQHNVSKFGLLEPIEQAGAVLCPQAAGKIPLLNSQSPAA